MNPQSRCLCSLHQALKRTENRLSYLPDREGKTLRVAPKGVKQSIPEEDVKLEVVNISKTEKNIDIQKNRLTHLAPIVLKSLRRKSIKQTQAKTNNHHSQAAFRMEPAKKRKPENTTIAPQQQQQPM